MTFFVLFRFCCVFCRLNGHSSHPNNYLLYVTQKRTFSEGCTDCAVLPVDTFSAIDAFSLYGMLCYAPLISTSNPPRKRGLFLKEEKTKPWSECILSNEDRQFLRNLLNTYALTVIVLVGTIYVMNIVICVLACSDLCY